MHCPSLFGKTHLLKHLEKYYLSGRWNNSSCNNCKHNHSPRNPLFSNLDLSPAPPSMKPSLWEQRAVEDLEAGNLIHLLLLLSLPNAFSSNLQLKKRSLVTLAHAKRILMVVINPLKMNLLSNVFAHWLIESWVSVPVTNSPLMNHLVAEGTPEEWRMFL